MTSNYKRIGNYIRLVDERNKGLKVNRLLGLSITKEFIVFGCQYNWCRYGEL